MKPKEKVAGPSMARSRLPGAASMPPPRVRVRVRARVTVRVRVGVRVGVRVTSAAGASAGRIGGVAYAANTS